MKEQQKKLIMRLRKKGYTYSEIIKKTKTHIAKSTISYWCHNLPISQKKVNKKIQAGLARARRFALKKLRDKQNRYFKNIYKENSNLYKLSEDAKVSKLLLSVLYLAEGGKKQRGSIMFGNSDPNIIKLFLKLLNKSYDLDKSKFRCTLQARSGQNLTNLQKYWSGITKIPLNQFYKPRTDKRTVGKKIRNKDYKGVCRIDYFSAHIFHELTAIGNIICK